MEQLMSLLDDHKGSMNDSTYLALSNELKAAQEAEGRSVRLYEVTYVQLDLRTEKNEGVIQGTVRKMIAEEALEELFSVKWNQVNKSAELLSIGKVHWSWHKASLEGPILLWDDWGSGKLVTLVTKITPYCKRIRKDPSPTTLSPSLAPSPTFPTSE